MLPGAQCGGSSHQARRAGADVLPARQDLHGREDAAGRSHVGAGMADTASHVQDFDLNIERKAVRRILFIALIALTTAAAASASDWLSTGQARQAITRRIARDVQGLEARYPEVSIDWQITSCWRVSSARVNCREREIKHWSDGVTEFCAWNWTAQARGNYIYTRTYAHSCA